MIDPGLRTDIRSAALQMESRWPVAKASKVGPVDVVDFFSGCGGMSAGFLSLNSEDPTYRLALAVDTDTDAIATYNRNLGPIAKQLDVSELAKDLENTQRLIDSVRTEPDSPLVMIGCAPCQGFSSHRNASGKRDLRNSLFVAFAQIAAAVGPDVIIAENVPEILTDRYWPLVAEARQILSKAGYESRIAIHDMAEFGVPQQRFRALLIAMRRPVGMPKGFLARGEFRTVRDAIGNLSRIEPGVPSPHDAMHVTAGHRASTVETIMCVPADGGSRPANVGPDCLRRAATKQGRAAYEDVYGRLWWDRPAITMTAYSRNPASGRYVHPEQHRGLSVREAALLQGFPSDYMFEGSFDSRFRQIGNAVPPMFAAALGAYIASVLRGSEEVECCAGRDITGPIGPSFSRLIPAIKAGHRTIGDAGADRRAKAA
ncbi:DNA cytosine methyltransferase [Citromicrobium bathyomarinum]